MEMTDKPDAPKTMQDVYKSALNFLDDFTRLLIELNTDLSIKIAMQETEPGSTSTSEKLIQVNRYMLNALKGLTELRVALGHMKTLLDGLE